jgi:valyl-tRNA synthetase
MEELTKEQIEKSVLASYDSVNLINELNSKESKTEEDLEIIDKNKEHIKIMLSKDWFVKVLTADQKEELQATSK